MSTLRHLFGFIALCILGLTASAADPKTYPAKEAKLHQGETANVVGVISDVHVSTSGAVFINFGGQYPNHDFTAVVLAANVAKFPGLAGLEGKTVTVSGLIKEYHGKPEIVLEDPKQLGVPAKD